MDEAIRKGSRKKEVKRIRRKYQKKHEKNKASKKRNYQRRLLKEKQTKEYKRLSKPKNWQKATSVLVIASILAVLFKPNIVHAAENRPTAIIQETTQNVLVLRSTLQLEKIEQEKIKKEQILEIVQLEEQAIVYFETTINSGEYEVAVNNMEIATDLLEQIEKKKNEYSLEYNMDTLQKKQEQATKELNKFQIFYITSYCACLEICCKKPDGIMGQTASGKMATPKHTIAMDPQYPFGTKVYISGIGEYIVEDRGGDIKGNRIDLFYSTHTQAQSFKAGEYYVKVD